MIPQITGVSELQRSTKKVLNPLKNDRNHTIFLAQNNKAFAVIISMDYFKELHQDKESLFWLSCAETSLDFWNHPSNDIYNELI